VNSAGSNIRYSPRSHSRRRVVAVAGTLLAGVALLVALPKVNGKAATAEPVPTGTLTAPAANAALTAGATITLTTKAVDTAATGYPLGVTDVEWWLFSDTTLGDSANFSAQYPGNTQNIIFLGDSQTPTSGTTANGTWSTTFTLPTNGQLSVTRDGQFPGGMTTPRVYQLPTGTYSIQSHLHNAWWDAHLAGASGQPGKTPMVNVTINAGASATPTPTATPTSATPTPTPTPATPTPTPTATTPAATNLVQNPSLENGTGLPPTCFEQSGWGSTPTYSAVAGHTGSRAVKMVTTGYTSGDGKLMPLESTACAPAVTAGQTYPLGVWYQSTTAVNLTLFRHTAAGWVYWTDLATEPPSTAWAQATAATPVIPAGTDYITFGLSLAANGTLVVDDFSAGGSGPVTTPTPTPTPTGPAPSPTNLIANPTLATGTGTPDCFLLAGWGTHSDALSITTDVPTGSVAGTRSYKITLSGYASGDDKLIQNETVGCAPNVTPGKTYNLSVAYKSTTASNSLTVFMHNASGWVYWTDIKGLPISTAWTTATATTPAIPAGVDRISWGVSIAGNGTLNTTNYSMVDPTAATPTGTAAIGSWSVITPQLPLRAIHSTLLSNGKLLLIAGSGNDADNFAAGTFKTYLWDPVTNVFTSIPTPYDMFCAGHVTLPNGNILVLGGTKAFPTASAGPTTFEGSPHSYIFNITTNTYQATNDMNTGHWYPTATKLGNGNIWAAGGLNENAEGTVATEMFDTASQKWLPLTQVPQTWSFWGLYPGMILMSDGRLFYNGVHTFGSGLPGSGASVYNWQTATITDVPGLRDKDLRDQAGYVLLGPAQNQTVMVIGGGNTETNANAINLVDIIHLNDANPTYTPAADLPGPGKGYVNALNLPNRTVFTADGASHNRTDNVNTAAIYNDADGTWTSIDPDPVGRNYHSSAILLPDGRVVTLGSNPLDNTFELRISIYSPAYLFTTGTRPTITASPATATYGQAISLGVTGNISSASLISPASVTHQSDSNGRLVDLPISGTGNTLTAQIPANNNLVPPGPYMLTVLDANGKPSVAKWITIG
jgi:hypothetical protein